MPTTSAITVVQLQLQLLRNPYNDYLIKITNCKYPNTDEHAYLAGPVPTPCKQLLLLRLSDSGKVTSS